MAAHLWNLVSLGAEEAALAALRGSTVMQEAATALNPDTGESLLHVAARRGFDRLAADLLVLGLDANLADKSGMTPVHVAVVRENPAVLQLLLARGGDPALPCGDDKARNAYHLATAVQDTAVMQVLLEAPDSRGLYHFISEGRCMMDTLRCAMLAGRADLTAMLVGFGVSLNARGPDNKTTLQFLIEYAAHNVTSFGLLLDLQDAGADLFHVESAVGETLLHQAARVGWTQAFEHLLDCGLPVDAVTRNGDTLLHAAARGPRDKIMSRVMAMEPDIDARNRQGDTPLHVAAHRNRFAHVEMLLNAGANPLMQDRMGRTPDMVCQAPVQQATHKLVIAAQRRFLLQSPRGALQKRGGFPPSNRR